MSSRPGLARRDLGVGSAHGVRKSKVPRRFAPSGRQGGWTTPYTQYVSSRRGRAEGLNVCHPERLKAGGILGLVWFMACEKARSLVALLRRDDKIAGAAANANAVSSRTARRAGGILGLVWFMKYKEARPLAALRDDTKSKVPRRFALSGRQYLKNRHGDAPPG